MKLTENPSITVLIPCLNEQKEVGAVVRAYYGMWPDCQVLVVDNCSTVETIQAAKSAGAQVLVERRRGKAQAVLSALPYIETEVLIVTKADGSYPIEGARRLLEFYGWERPDMVTGIRRTEEEAWLPSDPGVYGKILKSVFGDRPNDVFSEMRLFSKYFYKNIPILLRGFDLELELAVQALDKHFRIADVPVPFIEKERKVSRHFSISAFISPVRFWLVLLRDYKPLFAFGTVAALFAAAGLLAGYLPIYEYVTTHVIQRIMLPVLAASLMVIAFFTLQIGIVLEASLRHRRETHQTQLRRYYDNFGSSAPGA